MNYVIISKKYITFLQWDRLFLFYRNILFSEQLKIIYMNNPSAPKKITWIIGLIFGILGIIGHFAHIQVLSEHSFTLLLIGFVVLAVGTTVKGI